MKPLWLLIRVRLANRFDLGLVRAAKAIVPELRQ
jgi:hypothetical protein